MLLVAKTIQFLFQVLFVVVLFGPSSIMPSTGTAEALSSSSTAAASSNLGNQVDNSDDQMTKVLKHAFPHLISYESKKVISQANAEGQRLLLTLHDTDDQAVPYDHEVFVKKVAVADYIATKKDWADLRRTLLYMRTEVRFYNDIYRQLHLHFAPKIYVAQHSLAEEGWMPDDESGLSPAGAPPAVYEAYHRPAEKDDSSAKEVKGSGEIVMDCVNDEEYFQASPISVAQSKQCLTAVAQLHAAAWRNESLLKDCAERLSLASFHLEVRNPKELDGMEASWEHFATQFAGPLQEANLVTRTKTLGKRLKDAAKSISQQLSPRYNDEYATVVHGDYKAMNVFLPRKTAPKLPALMVDFASTGIGLGVSDLAMHIHHAVLPQDLANGGEEELVDFYLQELERLLPDGETYPRDTAEKHYRMAVIDYGRFVLGRFWKTATPETFEKRKDSPNTTLINRNVEAAMAFIDRLERYLTEFENRQANNGGEL